MKEIEYIEKLFLDRYENPQGEQIVTLARKDLDMHVIKARIEELEDIQNLGYKSENLSTFGNEALDKILERIAQLKKELGETQ